MERSETKKLFADAFLSLAQTNSVDGITVQKLLEACGAARQTFYNHFLDKNDLICWIYTNAMDQVLQHYGEGGNLANCYYHSYRMFQEHPAFYTKCIRSTGQNNLLDQFFRYTRMYFIQHIQTQYGPDALDASTQFMIDFYCRGTVEACRDWMINGMQRPAEEMTKLTLQCMPQELKRFFPKLENAPK